MTYQSITMEMLDEAFSAWRASLESDPLEDAFHAGFSAGWNARRDDDPNEYNKGIIHGRNMERERAGLPKLKTNA